MQATVVYNRTYRDYEADDYNTPVAVPFDQPAYSEATAYASLGPFHIPEFINFEVYSDGRCRAEIGYPNEERGERHPRSVPGTNNKVLLGKHSRKILELHVADIRPFLHRQVEMISEDVGRHWLSDLPGNRKFACRRNAVVVAGILNSMPQTLRDEILKGLAGQG